MPQLDESTAITIMLSLKLITRQCWPNLVLSFSLTIWSNCLIFDRLSKIYLSEPSALFDKLAKFLGLELAMY